MSTRKFPMIMASAAAFLLQAAPAQGMTPPEQAPAAVYSPAWGEWSGWGDMGDGSYRNPIIPSDYSDIDCIRVGDDYYAISSTFQFSPGMTILHSEDLVNWEICGHAVPDISQIGPELNWDRMNRYGRGIWAGTLRYHEGRFYVFFGTPDEGYFMTSAPKPEGPWEPLTTLLAQSGWDDCTFMWDDDGKAYFVGTHFADGYKTYIFDMAPDGRSVDWTSGRLINEGSGREANKLIKVGKWYYLVFSESNNGRYVMAKRSEKITGPYLEEKQLAVAGRENKEPNQGGLVVGRDGKWYFFTHHGTGDWGGRMASLLPVSWIDGWPIIGDVREDGLGSMTWSGVMPYDKGNKYRIATSDEFSSRKMGQQWQWNYQPREEMYSLSGERKGWLRLKAFRPVEENTLFKAGNTLTQRCFRTERSEICIKMDLRGTADGQRSGLCHFSRHSAAVGIVNDGGRNFLEFRHDDNCSRGPEINGRYIWLKSEWGLDGVSRFSYSLDGKEFTPFGEEYQLCWGYYRGDRIGIYCFNDKSDEGYVDVDFFRYTMER